VGINTWSNGGALRTDLAILQVQAMQQKIEADAGAWLESLNATGRVAVYGINFDSNKSVIRPDSEQVLAEILKLVQDNPDLKLKVEGHTDNVGKAKANLQLSKERAAAVKAWLVKHGVASTRLATDGSGDSKPVDDNSTEEGRANNRRVELVKM
jgi:OmpA-OmpF porin, OOP family